VKRRLFNILAAVSLVLCVATVVMWVRSYFVVDLVGHWMIDTGASQITVEKCGGIFSQRGVVAIASGTRWMAPTFLDNYHHRHRPLTVATDQSGWITWRHHENSLPHWVYGLRGDVDFFGFFIDSGPRWGPWRPPGLTYKANTRTIWIPYWFLCFVASIAPGLWCASLWLNRMRLLRLIRLGLCVTCGYDLTGNVSGVCPECGKPIAAASVKPGGESSAT